MLVPLLQDGKATLDAVGYLSITPAPEEHFPCRLHAISAMRVSLKVFNTSH